MIVDDLESDIETLGDVLNGVITGGFIASREDVPFLKGRFPRIHGGGDLRETAQERGCAEGEGMGRLNVGLALLRQGGGDLGNLLHESHRIAPLSNRIAASSQPCKVDPSRLSRRYCPSVGVSRQPITFISVDLSELDGPMIAQNSLFSIAQTVQRRSNLPDLRVR